MLQKPQYRVELTELPSLRWSWKLYQLTHLHISGGTISEGDTLITEGAAGQFMLAAEKADLALNHHFKLWHREHQKGLKHAS